MPVDQRHCRAVFQKLQSELGRIQKHSSPESVHKLRTSARRVETVLEELVPEPDKNTRKLLKSLTRLRHKAGKVRDLDVQTTLLGNLKIAQEGGEKAQLLRLLATERIKREKKLAKALDEDAVRGMRKRLIRARKEMQIPAGVDPLRVATNEFLALGREQSPITQKLLHQYRITGKRARYVVEIAQKSPEGTELIGQLEKLQDVVGDWHDWLALTERAENLFGGVKDSSLVAAMRNLTRAKFREGVDAVMRTRLAISMEKSESSAARPARKEPVKASQVEPAAA